MMDFNEVISKFDNPKRVKKGTGIKEAFQVRCPCHKDKENSLTVSLADNGKPLFRCHAGCDTNAILEAVGLSWSDICVDDRKKLTCLERKAWYYGHEYEWTDDNGKNHKGYGDGVRVTAEYPYHNEFGNYQYSKLRFEGGAIPGKLIRYYTIDRVKDEATACKMSEVEKCLYRLPEFQKLKRHSEYAYITEGEKDCETLRKLGKWFGCVTTAGGASDWRSEYATYFKGLKVVIFQDNDNAGYNASETIRKDLKPYAHSVKIVIPSRLDHGDVTDYLDKEDGSVKSLRDLCSEVKEEYAPWVNVNKDGEPTSINAGILAECISENETYIIIRNPTDDKDILLLYQKGVYVPMNKPSIKAMIKEYVPAAKVSDNLLNNVCNLLFATQDHVHRIEDVNGDYRYINFRNGLYNINTKELNKHSPDVISAIQFPFNFNPDKHYRHEVFDKYITDLCSKPDGTVDEDEIKIIQEYIGFLISNIPMSRIKAAMVLWSTLGNSGKSVLIRLNCRIFGVDRVATIKLRELTPDNRFILGTLPNCRLIACGDESNSNVTDSSIFKSLTGGDPVKIEPKGKQGYSFEYKGGFVIACNGLPCFVDDKGNHLYDRLIILPCEHHITDDIKDASLDEKLAAEIPGIVMWALEGLHRLIDNGYRFTKSKSSELSKEAYHKAMDNVYRFVTENYVVTHEYNDRVSKKDFDDAYHRWACSDDSIKEVERKNLSARMEAIGITSGQGNIRDRRNVVVYRGIKEKSTEFVSIPDVEIPFDSG